MFYREARRIYEDIIAHIAVFFKSADVFDVKKLFFAEILQKDLKDLNTCDIIVLIIYI